MTTREELIGGYPPIGMLHKNGDRLYGYTTGYSPQLLAAGTPNVSNFPLRHLTPEVEKVRIGDRLEIVFRGDRWEALRDGVLVGVLQFSVKNRGLPVLHFEGNHWDSDTGTLIVERLKISSEDRIVNIGGTAYPEGHPLPTK